MKVTTLVDGRYSRQHIFYVYFSSAKHYPRDAMLECY